ncbi:hypothetical protein [Promicromonospora sp. NPDC050880]|uniref:hypothetical protein n=1 Tax=Promicromonospora sp. NPDC050880 TaxID=3364406 RepID=UPI0037AC129E
MESTMSHAVVTGRSLRTVAAGAFVLAVLAGIAEAILAVTSIAGTTGLGGGVLVQVAVRGAVFATALTCAWYLARGRRWAWWALLLGLGGAGLASMLVPMAAALADGASWSTVFDAGTSPLFPAVRALHILSVLVGVTVMLHPGVRASLGRIQG